MLGAIPPLHPYVFMAQCLVKHRDNSTFTFNFIYFHIFRVGEEENIKISLKEMDR
jgi:hypothetical protein